MPNLAAFPKAFLDSLCVDGSDNGFVRLDRAGQLARYRQFGVLRRGLLGVRRSRRAGRNGPVPVGLPKINGLRVPMLSLLAPTSRTPIRSSRQHQVDLEKGWIDMTAVLGGQFCRVLSGQRRPDVSRADGLRFAAECIEACLPHAAANGVTLDSGECYKDNYWQFPEFRPEEWMSSGNLVDRDPFAATSAASSTIQAIRFWPAKISWNCFAA